jgi:hypothetical protein
MPRRRFSPPWDIDDDGACFIVRDHNGQALAYVYFEEQCHRSQFFFSAGDHRLDAAGIATSAIAAARFDRHHATRRVAFELVRAAATVDASGRQSRVAA